VMVVGLTPADQVCQQTWLASGDVPPPSTDDHPFLYVNSDVGLLGIPWIYVIVLSMIMALSVLAIGVVGGHRSGGRLGVKDDDVGARHDVTGQRTRWATEGTGNASRSSGNAGTRAIDDVRGSGPRYHGPTSSRFRLCNTPPQANLGVLVTQCPKAVVA